MTTTPAQKKCPEYYEIDAELEDLNLTLYLVGEFGLKNLTAFERDIRQEISRQKLNSVTIDFSKVCYLDSAAALALLQMEKDTNYQEIKFLLVNLSDESKGIFSVIHENALMQRSFRDLPDKDSFIRKIGQSSSDIAGDFAKFITFIGELIVAMAYMIRHPETLRGKDVFFYVQRAGVDGLPIVALIGALIGLIIAFMSYLQLKMIGANIYVPALVSFAMIKELGPIMTAILVAGRSGSSFAAEIGTMVVNEEVDALHTMGFDPIRFLAVPKVLATIIVVPILTVYADFFGIFGGMIIGVTSLDLTIKTYISQSIKSIQVFDIITSLIKAGVFAALIAAVGCQKGFQVRSGAQDVGKFTTSAVVTAIFLIVVTDSIFAIMFYYIK
ncbi:MAG: MlaE family lipid ABC transporter permease subunit [Deltaproteobacteria bacterium]|nr:MlaE family lipid ABC transporter permease subunit [Deltaproteobacteria bacterium]